jgi:hypothetical protein
MARFFASQGINEELRLLFLFFFHFSFTFFAFLLQLEKLSKDNNNCVYSTESFLLF